MKDPRIKRYTPHWYFKWFREYFPELRAQDFIDMDLLLWGKQAHLDIIKFDDRLHELHGQYEDQGMSMKDLITKEYGPMAARWVEVAIGPQESKGESLCT